METQKRKVIFSNKITTPYRDNEVFVFNDNNVFQKLTYYEDKSNTKIKEIEWDCGEYCLILEGEQLNLGITDKQIIALSYQDLPNKDYKKICFEHGIYWQHP